MIAAVIGSNDPRRRFSSVPHQPPCRFVSHGNNVCPRYKQIYTTFVSYCAPHLSLIEQTSSRTTHSMTKVHLWGPLPSVSSGVHCSGVLVGNDNGNEDADVTSAPAGAVSATMGRVTSGVSGSEAGCVSVFPFPDAVAVAAAREAYAFQPCCEMPLPTSEATVHNHTHCRTDGIPICAQLSRGARNLPAPTAKPTGLGCTPPAPASQPDPPSPNLRPGHDVHTPAHY